MDRDPGGADGSTPSTIAVIGAGTMGRGIAAATAAGGLPVTLFDVEESALESAREWIVDAAARLVDAGVVTDDEPAPITERVGYVTSIADAVADADLVVEAVPEDRGIKVETYERIERHAPTEAVVATNTSSLPLADLEGAFEEAGRFCGAHWFHPAHVVPVVEVVYGESTTDATVDRTCAYLEAIGKDPVVLERDLPGFIANRMQLALNREAWALVEAGVASAEDVDRAVKGSFGFRLPVLGVLEKDDHAGLDVHHKVMEELLPDIDRRTEPPAVLEELVEAGRLGVKSGRGVYDWSAVSEADLSALRDDRLLELLEVYETARDVREDLETAGDV